MATLSFLPRPTFVYGALRSGTTVFRLMLDAHPAHNNPGEAEFLLDHLHPDPAVPDGWRYDRKALAADRKFIAQAIPVPDDHEGFDLLKYMISTLESRSPGSLSLNVHRDIGRLADILPDARFIHVLRDPRDVARSSVGMGWVGNSYYGADHWVATETAWDQAGLPEDRVLTVRFETLMSETESELTRVCHFLGLPFDPAMLGYYRNTTYGPPNPKIIQQWRRKAGAREIALIECRTGALMAARGYPPETDMRAPDRLESATLAVGNRLKRWRFNIRRYGLPLYAATHATRLIGARSLHRHLRQRQDEITIRTLQ